MLTHHDLHVPAGLTNSRVISCDIGDNAAIHSVRYLSHVIVGTQEVNRGHLLMGMVCCHG